MTKEEINEMEQRGIKIMKTDSDGKIIYQTEEKGDEPLCNNCRYLRLLPDPNPLDDFTMDDQKAVCKFSGKTIATSLNVWEASKVYVPDNCPLNKG